MSAKAMKELREAAKLTQSEMAALMGLGKTAYVDLEGDDPDWKKFKHRHLLALEHVSLMLAVERRDINLALASARRDALDLARMILGQAPYQVAAQAMNGIRLTAGCGTPEEAINVGRAYFASGCSSVSIIYEGRAYSVEQLSQAMASERL